MIQRIQSLALLLASVCSFLSLKFPFYSGFDKEMKPAELNATSDLPIMIMTIAVGMMALINIFLFKNRSLQFLFCLGGIMIQGWVIFLYFNESATYQSGHYALASLLQPLVVVFFFIAARGVKKDMNIIRESERLR